MKIPNLRRTIPLAIAVAAIAGTAAALPGASTADAAGLRNCVDITGSQSGRVGCWEDVWADGREVRMTFANTQYRGATSADIDPFYFLAPQGAVAQGALPIPHDHVIDGVPSDSSYAVHLHGWFVLCTGQGIASGACTPEFGALDGVNQLPFASRVNGAPLTSTDSIEAAVDAGVLVLIDTGAVLIGTVTGK